MSHSPLKKTPTVDELPPPPPLMAQLKKISPRTSMGQSRNWKLIKDRCLNICKLDDLFYEQCRNDPSIQEEAMWILAFTSITSGIASLWMGLPMIMMSALISFAIGFAMPYLTHWMSLKLYGQQLVIPDINVFKRLLWYARAPGILSIVGVIPVLGTSISMLASLWSLITFYIATKKALRSSFENAFIVCLSVWVVCAIFFGILGALGFFTANGFGMLQKSTFFH